MRSRGFFCNAVLIGDGEDRLRLEGIVKERGVNKQVWFYGACYDEKQNAELIYNADMCVVPGDVGLTAIHSMMFGTPVISHNYFP
jgi:glycosyltransferase involved in cell wall biosynthesis